MVTTTISLFWRRASTSWELFEPSETALPLSSRPIMTTCPVTLESWEMVFFMFWSSDSLSVTTTTLENIFSPSARRSLARSCAAHEMVSVLPEPAECSMR